nr:hypothetical protein [Tanacetum cinerariifolium]
MASLTFADTHYMVAFLSKSDASAGFDQIVDFLNAQVIRYALMVNPTIYVSCIKHFWATASIKKANDVVKLQALIDRKKVVVTEDVIRQDLCLDDADGVECLPNEDIFAELARMGYEKPPPKLTFYNAFLSAQWKFLIHTLVQCVSAKRTAWNEFSCSMASAVICLATGRKFNFSKYIFDSMVRNVDSPSKFLMYPRFLQVLINNQVDDLSSHTTRYISHALSQKVFANMRRVGKGFSGVETSLFASMLVQPQAVEVEEDVEVPAAPTPPSPTIEPSPPPQDPITTPPQAQPATPHATPPQEQPTDTSESSMTLLNTLMETCATLSQKFTQLKQDKIAQALEILKLKKLEKKRKSKSSGLKRLKKVGTSQRVEFSTETVMGDQEDASKQEEKIEAIDDDEDITLVDMKTQVDLGAEFQGRKDDDNAATKDVNAAEPIVFDDEEVTMTMAQTLIKMKAEKARLLDEQMAKRLHDEEVEQAAAREKKEKDDLEKAKGLQQQKYQSLKRKPVSIAQARKNMAGYKMEHFRVEVSGYESTQETPTNDPKEMSEEDVQNMLEIVPIYEFKVEALQVKVGGITEAYQSFEDMLKGFDREDLDALWRLVKEKFSSAVPNVDKEKTLWVELKRLMLLGKDDSAAEVMKKLL